jgi:hypothetical protein
VIRIHRVVLTAFVVVVLGVLGVLVACSSDTSEPGAPGAQVRSSFLAVGDTGAVWGGFPGFFEGQLAVGAAMHREHERDPVDALVLLGDNFYPSGLLASELRHRVLQNVVRPYCGFVEPSAELEKTAFRYCGMARESTPRLLAIIGNHDLLTPHSLELQRREVPRLVRNWDMPLEDGPTIRELPGGLSLILLVSEWPWNEEASLELARVLREARGPWHIVVGHRPPISGHPALSKMVADASRVSGRTVHAYLAGHVHGLAAIRGASPAPLLTVIAGSGSHAKLQEEPEYQIEGADVMVEALGFVRVDAVGPVASPRLRITLSKARTSAALALFGTTTIARYEIDLEGRVDRTDRAGEVH